MASSSCLMCSSSSKVGYASDLSSSSAFVNSSSSALPVTGAQPVPRPASRLAAPKCASSEEEHAATGMGRRMLAGVVATGAALAVFTNMAVAAQGPGQLGARRVAEKADKLLKAADKLNIEEAPPRFGPGRPGGAADPTKISQIAGSGLTDSSKKGFNKANEAANDAGKGISDATKEVKSNTGGGFLGFGKKKTESVTDQASDLATNVQRKIIRDGLGRFRGAANDVESAAKDAIGQAQSKTNIGNSGGNVLSSLQEGLQGLRGGIAR